MTAKKTAPKTAKGMPLKPLDQILVNLEQAAALCSVGVTTWDQWVATGNAPQPVRVAATKATLWRRRDIEDWAAKLPHA